MKKFRSTNCRSTLTLIQFALVLAFLPLSAAAAEPVLIGYSDYQIATDFTFNAEEHFREMKDHGVNLQRIWIPGYSNSIPFKRERMPFVKKGRLYRLDVIDKQYLNRLRKILASAREHDQQVMLTLFDRWSMAVPKVWIKSPWYYKNNTQRLLRNALPDFYDLQSNPRLARLQKRYVKAIVEATSEFDPIYEIMNEASLSGGCGLLSQWHGEVAAWIKEAAPDVRIAANVIRGCQSINEEPWADIVSFHWGEWDEGGICELVEKYRAAGKTVIIDTDGAWRKRDDNRLVRRWLQETLRCGGSFNHKDDIYALDYEALEIFRNLRQARDKHNEIETQR